jgi:hypothetical protein
MLQHESPYSTIFTCMKDKNFSRSSSYEQWRAHLIITHKFEHTLHKYFPENWTLWAQDKLHGASSYFQINILLWLPKWFFSPPQVLLPNFIFYIHVHLNFKGITWIKGKDKTVPVYATKHIWQQRCNLMEVTYEKRYCSTHSYPWY